MSRGAVCLVLLALCLVRTDAQDCTCKASWTFNTETYAGCQYVPGAGLEYQYPTPVCSVDPSCTLSYTVSDTATPPVQVELRVCDISEVVFGTGDCACEDNWSAPVNAACANQAGCPAANCYAEKTTYVRSFCKVKAACATASVNNGVMYSACTPTEYSECACKPTSTFNGEQFQGCQYIPLAGLQGIASLGYQTSVAMCEPVDATKCDPARIQYFLDNTQPQPANITMRVCDFSEYTVGTEDCVCEDDWESSAATTCAGQQLCPFKPCAGVKGPTGSFCVVKNAPCKQAIANSAGKAYGACVSAATPDCSCKADWTFNGQAFQGCQYLPEASMLAMSPFYSPVCEAANPDLCDSITYYTEASGNVVSMSICSTDDTTAALDANTDCECADTWSAPVNTTTCTNIQGCPLTSCGGSFYPWCQMKSSAGCKNATKNTAAGGVSYGFCTNPCACKASWTFNGETYAGCQYVPGAGLEYQFPTPVCAVDPSCSTSYTLSDTATPPVQVELRVCAASEVVFGTGDCACEDNWSAPVNAACANQAGCPAANCYAEKTTYVRSFCKVKAACATASVNNGVMYSACTPTEYSECACKPTSTFNGEQFQGCQYIPLAGLQGIASLGYQTSVAMCEPVDATKCDPARIQYFLDNTQPQPANITMRVCDFSEYTVGTEDCVCEDDWESSAATTCAGQQLCPFKPCAGVKGPTGSFCVVKNAPCKQAIANSAGKAYGACMPTATPDCSCKADWTFNGQAFQGCQYLPEASMLAMSPFYLPVCEAANPALCDSITYYTEASGNVVSMSICSTDDTTAALDANTDCECADTWSAPVNTTGCTNIQGCPTTSCGGSFYPWCQMKSSAGCKNATKNTAAGGVSYGFCTNPCACKASWTFNGETYAGCQYVPGAGLEYQFPTPVCAVDPSCSTSYTLSDTATPPVQVELRICNASEVVFGTGDCECEDNWSAPVNAACANQAGCPAENCYAEKTTYVRSFCKVKAACATASVNNGVMYSACTPAEYSECACKPMSTFNGESFQGCQFIPFAGLQGIASLAYQTSVAVCEPLNPAKCDPARLQFFLDNSLTNNVTMRVCDFSEYTVGTEDCVCEDNWESSAATTCAGQQLCPFKPCAGVKGPTGSFCVVKNAPCKQAIANSAGKAYGACMPTATPDCSCKADWTFNGQAFQGCQYLPEASMLAMSPFYPPVCEAANPALCDSITYYTEASGNVVSMSICSTDDTTAALDANTDCECADTWSAPVNTTGCTNIQGCPTTSCGGSFFPWCQMKSTAGCKNATKNTAAGGVSYGFCTPDAVPTTPAPPVPPTPAPTTAAPPSYEAGRECTSVDLNMTAGLPTVTYTLGVVQPANVLGIEVTLSHTNMRSLACNDGCEFYVSIGFRTPGGAASTASGMEGILPFFITSNETAGENAKRFLGNTGPDFTGESETPYFLQSWLQNGNDVTVCRHL